MLEGKKGKERIDTMCNKGCDVNLGIGPHLLGMTKEYMILHVFTCYKCIAK